jgi:hypothetical protein
MADVRRSALPFSLRLLYAGRPHPLSNPDALTRNIPPSEPALAGAEEVAMADLIYLLIGLGGFGLLGLYVAGLRKV